MSEKMAAIRKNHLSGKGFLKMKYVKMYLPRETKDELHSVNGQDLIVKKLYKKNSVDSVDSSICSKIIYQERLI